MKQTQKTPKRKIEKAKNLLEDYKRRSGKQSPNADTLLKILKAVGCTIEIIQIKK